MVPDADPYEYVILCVRLLDARSIVIFRTVPIRLLFALVDTPDAGMTPVKLAVVVPTSVSPLYVLQVTVPVFDEFPDAICADKLFAGVQLTDVLLVFVAIVPVALPNSYVSVCLNVFDAAEIVIVRADPSVVDPEMLIVEARGMFVRVHADPLERLRFGTMFPVCVLRLAEICPAAIVFLPSES